MCDKWKENAAKINIEEVFIPLIARKLSTFYLSK